MLAGLVIGALGVLADMGVTQASAVMALRRANPEQSAFQLYRGAFTVGRDHHVATTHTLVLAYVGATLPLLLVLRTTGAELTDALNTQDIAEPVIATLVGAMACSSRSRSPPPSPPLWSIGRRPPPCPRAAIRTITEALGRSRRRQANYGD